MARSRYKSRTKSGLENGSFAAIPHAVIRSDAWKGLTDKAKVLLIELFAQFTGKNNGNLCAAPKTMAEFGWSNTPLHDARQELEQAGLIVKTQQGGKNRPNLYGVTWKAIDDCAGKLEHPPTHAPLGYWKLGHNPEAKPKAKLKPKATKNDSTIPSHGMTQA